MADQRLKDLRGPSRRGFLKYFAAAGAVLALDRAKVLDVLCDTGGSALADDSCAMTNRSLHVVAGTGGFAWFNLLWPQIAVATSTNPGFAFHAQGSQIKATDTDNPFYYAPESPWQGEGNPFAEDKTKRITAFMAGQNETHSTTPSSAATLGAGSSMLAAVTAIQRATPSLLPVIGVNPVDFGAASGAPDIALVDSADGLVQLFNSAASRAILSAPKDASLFEAYYKAFVGLDKAAGRPTWAAPLRTGKASANFLGKNLASQLAPTMDDFTAYGLDSSTPTTVMELGKAMITAVKAFNLGLTQAVIVPAFNDDPHNAFQNMASLQMTVASLGKVFDQFMVALQAIKDPTCTGKTLADATIITVHGDTAKDPFNNNGWPDGTPNNGNWMYTMGNGWLKTGWFGGANSDGTTDGFDPTSGATITGQSSMVTSAPAGAAVAYAVAKGDIRRVDDFYSGPPIDGIINATTT